MTERGDFRTHGYFQYDEFKWLVGGAGMLGVSNRNRVIGNFVAQASREFTANTFVGPRTMSCELEGTVWERHLMVLRIDCSGDGVAWNELVEIGYVGISYEYQPSSLDTIAGNYTLRVAPETNTFNINADGVVFGMFHLGFTCTVNGQVSLIDSRYNMYWMEWLFSNCSQPAPRFEGAEYRGIAGVAPPDFVNDREGTVYVLMSGMTDDGFNYLSLLYDPV